MLCFHIMLCFVHDYFVALLLDSHSRSNEFKFPEKILQKLIVF